jgi:iron(III) transport system substrate-binding protein
MTRSRSSRSPAAPLGRRGFLRTAAAGVAALSAGGLRAAAGTAHAQDARLEAARKEGNYTFYQSKKKGNPVDIVHPKEGVPLVVSPSAITSFAPHPSAARLFTDFGFTREVQQVLADSEGLYTGHPEVKYPAGKPRLGDLKLLPADPEELEKRNEEIKKRFVEFFGA